MQLKAFLLFVGAAIAAAKPQWRELHNYTFEKFVEEYKLNYKVGTTEFEQRRELFKSELARIVAHNANSRSSWKEGVNHMTAMTATEKTSLGGRSESLHQANSNKLTNKQTYPSSYNMMAVSALPTDVDWRKEGPYATAVKDQGHCGSCWAFASTAVIESHVAIASGLLFDLSPQQIAACAPNPSECGGSGNCNGATAEMAFDYAAGSKKLVESFMYPYTEYFGEESGCSIPQMASSKASISGFIQTKENDYEELMNAIARQGPVAVSVDASTWHSYESGIFDGCDQSQPDINHAVVLMGYGTDNGKDYWLIRNSWSASWGEAGYIRLARENEEKKCGQDITPCDGTACAGTCDQPVTVCGTCGVLYDSAYPTGASA